MVGIKSYTQNKEEVKISKVRFFMGHPVFFVQKLHWRAPTAYSVFCTRAPTAYEYSDLTRERSEHM